MYVFYVSSDKFDYIIECEKYFIEESEKIFFYNGKYMVMANSFFDSFYNDDNNTIKKENGLNFEKLMISDYLSYSYIKKNEVKKNE